MRLLWSLIPVASTSIACLLAAILAVPAIAPFPIPVSLVRKPSGTKSAVLFAVSGSGPNSPVVLAPILFVRGGKFFETPHPSLDGETAASAQFARSYFAANKSYRLIFGGRQVGTVRVVRLNPPSPGVTFNAAGQIQQGKVHLGGPVKALATDATRLVLKGSGRRAPSKLERAQAIKLAREAFRNRGISEAEIQAMQVVNLTACDLNADGSFELIGSFSVASRVHSAAVRQNDAAAQQPASGGGDWTAQQNLFCILEPAGGGGYRFGRSEYHASKSEDGVDVEEQTLLDAVDLDNDGVYEVVTQSNFYESWAYDLYQKVGGTWKAVYHSYGGGA